FLASPPLVVAYALAGRIDIDFDREVLGTDASGAPVYLKDVWPSAEELDQALEVAANPAFYRETYSADIATKNPLWKSIPQATGEMYPWEADSTYIKEPPFLDEALRKSTLVDIEGARPLAILGNSITTDHISPIGSIKSTSPA